MILQCCFRCVSFVCNASTPCVSTTEYYVVFVFAAPQFFFVKTEVERQVEESKESMSMDFLQKLIQKQRSATESGAHLNLSQSGLPLFLQTTSNG